MKAAISLVSILLTPIVFAQTQGVSETGIRYNEVSVGYERFSVSSATLTGYSVGATALLEKNIILGAIYSDVSKSSNSVTSTDLSVGYRLGIAGNVDAVVRAGYLGAGGNNTDSSYSVGAGINALVAPSFVLGGGIGYTGLGSGTFLYTGSASYYVTDNVTLRGAIRRSAGDLTSTTYSLAAGYNF